MPKLKFLKSKKRAVMNASGVCSTKSSSLMDWIAAGTDAIVTKTLTVEPKFGYPNPTVAIDHRCVLQAMGLPNPGYENFYLVIKEIRTKYKNFPIICSLAAGNTQDFIKMTNYLERSVDAFELNVSCPHMKGCGSEIGYEPKLLKEIVDTVIPSVKRAVGIKMPYYPSDRMLAEVISALENSGAEFVTAINSVGKALMLGEDFAVSNKLGGLSGPAIKPLALGQVYRIKQISSIPIIGAGGIVDKADAQGFFGVGACAIQLGSGLRFYNSKKEFVQKIKKWQKCQIKDCFENQNKEDWE